MKKPSIFLALLCLMLAFSCLAEASMTPREQAQNYLTEVYCYTAEGAEAFVFEDDGKGTLTFYPKGHPTWAYKLIHADDRIIDGTTPFYTDYANYPGENGIRSTLRAMKEQHMLDNWAQGGQKALQDMLNHNSIVPTQALRAMLAGNTDSFEGNKLIEAFFLSCYGDEINWPEALREWRDETLVSYHFARPLTWAEQPDGVETVPNAQTSMGTATLTRFKGAAPDSLKAVFDAQPRLKGWQCLTGAVLDMQTPPNKNHVLSPRFSTGLAAFERGNERLLIALRKDENGVWQVFPFGTNALYGPPQRLTIDYGNRAYLFNIRYDHEGETTVFDVMLNTPTLNEQPVGEHCYIQRILFSGSDRTTTLTHDGNGRWSVTEVVGDQRTDRAFTPAAPMMLEAEDIHAFPRSLEEAMCLSPLPIPEGYTVAADVHLRQQKSSRSKDLGTLLKGVFVQMLGMEPGSPFDWVHAKAGGLTGYISSIYTAENPDTMSQSHLFPLLLAETTKETDLKKDTGWFSGTVQKLPKGTRMHVMMTRGRWLYVVIPRNQLHWRMDVDGTYGFIPGDAALIAPLPVQLDWLSDNTI